VVRHPAVWGTVAAIALLALATPALGMRLGSPSIDLPASSPVLQTANKISHAFPQTPSPAQVVVTGANVTGPQVLGAIAQLRARAAASSSIHEPVTTTVVAHGRALIIDVPLAGPGAGSVSNAALLALREHVLPQTLGQVSGITWAVTGDTANLHDDIAALHASTPAVIAFVAIMAFVLLMLAFRSVVLPLISIALNLLSVGAAYGVITLIFQDGRWQGPLGYTAYGAIIPWIPLFMLVILFGLSMDYHVFILSRIRELRSRGATTQEAVTGGIASSAGVVTSAAIIMAAVFSIFDTLPLIEFKILGVGLTAAVLIDATVVRGVLLPAAMTLLGERCWYLPRWLSWIPRGSHRGDAAPGAAPRKEPTLI
jgi:RND superfamily putative drug exporter